MIGAVQGQNLRMVRAVKSNAALRMGVIGTGTMGSNHARVLAGLSGVQLVGVADPDRAQRELVTGALGCPAVERVEALLDLGVDAVTIAAPTHLHRDIALACISHGVHVLVEKPIDVSTANADALIDAAARAGVTLGVIFQDRLKPGPQQLKALVEQKGRGRCDQADRAGFVRAGLENVPNHRFVPVQGDGWG